MYQTLKKYFKENLLFWSGMLLIILIMSLFLFENGQIESHILLNSYHTPFLDKFFTYLTLLGGGFPLYFGLVVMIFWFRKGLFIAGSQGVASLLTQPLKYLIARPRPLTLLGLENIPNRVVDYSIPGGFNTCPSGHSSAIFAFCACLAALLPSKYKGWQVAFLILGVIGCYSRVYLSCHFLEDILFGAFVGAVATAITYMLLFSKEWGEKPIYKMLSK